MHFYIGDTPLSGGVSNLSIEDTFVWKKYPDIPFNGRVKNIYILTNKTLAGTVQLQAAIYDATDGQLIGATSAGSRGGSGLQVIKLPIKGIARVKKSGSYFLAVRGDTVLGNNLVAVGTSVGDPPVGFEPIYTTSLSWSAPLIPNIYAGGGDFAIEFYDTLGIYAECEVFYGGGILGKSKKFKQKVRYL